MKLEEFLALKQEDQSIMQYVGRFNHLAQYAPDHVNLDHKKKAYFMRGLKSKIQTMMTSCLNASYHEAVNVAIASEEEYCKHKEAKKKKNVSSGSSGSNQKRKKIVYHPKNNFCPSFRPQQFQTQQQAFVQPAVALPYPR
jgi:hypothetical protein